MSKQPGFKQTRTCDECPWRKDVPPGRFPKERFIALRVSVKQGFFPLFACHKSPEEAPCACAGYLMVEGENNFFVRLAVIEGRFDPKKLEVTAPLYESYREMALANGVDLAALEEDKKEWEVEYERRRPPRR